MLFDLPQKVVLITGASSGIGKACAVEFHRAGARLAVAARSQGKLEDLASELGRDRVLPVTLDVMDAASRQQAVEKIRSYFGRIDVLVNNAGWASFGTLVQTPFSHVEHMLNLNLAGPIALTQLVLPEMIECRSGQIVNISSVVGTQPMPHMTVYCATKAALTNFTTSLRMELTGTGVDVILVSPGSTRTSFFNSAATVNVRAARMAATQYSPERVSRAIVRSCRHRRREVTLSASGKAITVIRRISHRMADAIMYRVAQATMPLDEGGE